MRPAAAPALPEPVASAVLQALAELKFENRRSRFDSELVLCGFELLGVDSLPRRSGIFALAVCDRQEQKAWVARDRLAVKSQYYRLNARDMVFGSEVKAMAAVGDQLGELQSGLLT